MSAPATPEPITKQTQAEAIREVFAERQSASVRETTIQCVEAGVFDVDRYEALIRAFMPVVRDALKDPRPDGLPFAMQMAQKNGDNSRDWAQPELLSREDFDFNIAQRATGIIQDIKRLQPLVDYRRERWGDDGLPSVPRWS